MLMCFERPCCITCNFNKINQMPPTATPKSYVVFAGRNPGVYHTWIDSYAQTSGFKERVVRVYEDTRESEFVWSSFCQSISSSSAVRTKAIVEQAINPNYGFSPDILKPIDIETSKLSFVFN